MVKRIKDDLKKVADPQKAKDLQRFFKTGKGEYGEGDIFIGVKVPDQRKIAKKYAGTDLDDLEKLLSSRIHEHRLTALLILVLKFTRADEAEKSDIYRFYLDNMQFIDNWDLVDLSADKILGAYLFDKDRALLYRLAKSCSLWERRIAILSTFHFIKNNEFKDSLRIAEILLYDQHDLIHKAVGWMLREIGKRDMALEERFLKEHCRTMPRTMLRYAIEKFEETKRKFYMKK